jgi:hypothetical protein
MISKTLTAINNLKSSLNVYKYISFRDFRLTIRNKLKMSKHDSLDYAKFQAINYEKQLHRKRTL